MVQFKSKRLYAPAALALLLATGGCANMAEFTDSLDKEWAQPSVEVTPKQTPPDPEAVRLRAEMKARQLAGLSAGSDCLKILEVAPEIIASEVNADDADLKLAQCQYHGLDFASARKNYRAAYDRTGSPEALKGLVLTELRDGRIPAAMDLLSQLNTDASQTDWQIFNAIGYANDLTGNFDLAEEAYVHAAALSPDKAAALNNLGMSYLRQDRPAEAIKAFRKALDREPSLSVARLNLRIALAATGDFAVALSGASEAEQASVLNSVGARALSRGDTDTAKWLFQQALEKNPAFYASAYENLERAHLMSGQ